MPSASCRAQTPRTRASPPRSSRWSPPRAATPPEPLSVAIVTGGARGIGRATAEKLARQDVAVAILDRDDRLGPAAAREIGAIFVHCDVADGAGVDAAFDQVEHRLGPVHALVNNAGINAEHDPVAMTEADWDRLIAVDLKSAWLCARRAIPGMRASGAGAIVNLSSIHTSMTRRGMFPYAAAKAGLVGLTRSLALEVGPDGIRVNAICPGVIRAGLVLERLARAPDPESVEQRMREVHPLGRIGTPEEVASVVAFLISDEASFVSGAAWMVDGGLSARFAT